jgi:peptide/nickel transport system substrate-binding protein
MRPLTSFFARRGIAALMLAAPIFAGTLAAAPAAQAKDDLVIGIAEFPASLHPSIDALLIKSYVLGFTIRTITTYDKDAKLICLLCTEVPTLENGLAKLEGNGMAVTIKLKPDLKWADGVPVTARDLAFTWKVGRDPNSGFSNTNAWTRATSVDVVDDHTAVLHLDRTLVSFAQWDQILPEHVEGPVYEKSGKAGDYINTTAFNRDPTNPGLWDGPYKITSYQVGSQIIMEPNPNWTGAKPGFKRVVLRFIGDTAALQANLLSGDIDLDNNLTIDQVLALRDKYPDRFNYTFSPSLTYGHIDLQKDNPILQDVRVRRALLMGIDRDTINKRLLGGMYKTIGSFVSPQNPFYDPSVPQVKYDPAGAKKLLAEAGWTPGADGICRDKDGHRLSLEFLSAAGFKLNELEMTVMQNEWKQECIETNLRFEPSRTLFGTTTKHRAYPGMVMYTWTSLVGESPRVTLGSDRIPTEANNYGGANFLAFADKRFDADIVTAETDLDTAKQKAAWSEMQHIYADQLPALPLFISAIPQALPKWLKGFGPSGTGQPFTQQAELWRSE